MTYGLQAGRNLAWKWNMPDLCLKFGEAYFFWPLFDFCQADVRCAFTPWTSHRVHCLPDFEWFPLVWRQGARWPWQWINFIEAFHRHNNRECIDANQDRMGFMGMGDSFLTYVASCIILVTKSDIKSVPKYFLLSILIQKLASDFFNLLPSNVNDFL